MNTNEWIGQSRKAIAPLRVSGHGQEHNTSRITQQKDCEEYCKRMGLELVQVVPIVETARKSTLRKKYAAILEQALKSGIRHVLFHKYDREARNLTDNENNEYLVRENKIVLHYVADGKVLHHKSPDSEFLNRDINAAINKHYSRDLSTKIKRATQTKAESGWFPGSIPPLGYIHQKQIGDKGFERRRGSIIIPDPNIKNIKIVQKEFELRAQKPTPSYKEIKKKIIEYGLVSPEEAKTYYVAGIQKRLCNIFYDQRFKWFEKEYKANHSRIISREIFWQVQETFGVKNPYGKNPEATFGNGWLTCADSKCKCSIVYDPVTKTIKATGEKKTFRYYHCTNGKNIHPNLKGLRITEENIMDQLGKAVSEISISEDFQKELLQALNEAQSRARRAIKEEIDSFSAALKGLENSEDEIYSDFKKGFLDEEGYKRQINRTREERKRLTNLMKNAQLLINETSSETVKSILELATNAKSLWKRRSPSERKELLDKLLSNRVLDGVTVRYEIIKPLRTLSEMSQDEKWRRR